MYRAEAQDKARIMEAISVCKISITQKLRRIDDVPKS